MFAVTTSEIFGLAAAVIASVGGGAVVVFASSSWLGKVWANRILESEKAKYSQELEELKSRYLRDTEKYKTSLKKSEFLFEKEYQAASAFVALVRSIRPTFANPDMDWYEACDQIALSFDRSEKMLEQYLARHGAVLREDMRESLGRCIATAADGKFRIVSEEDVDPIVNAMAADFYTDLGRIEQALLEAVRDQSRI